MKSPTIEFERAAWAARELREIRAELIRRERLKHQEAVRQCLAWFAEQWRAKEVDHA